MPYSPPEGRFPGWLNWSSLVIAIGLISSVNWIVIGMAVIWVPIVSVRLYREQETRIDMSASVEETVG